MKHKANYKIIGLIGFLFGLIAPIFGLFFGLQVSTILGNLLTFPLIIMAQLSGSAFGDWSGLVKLLAWGFSGLVWSAIFVGVKNLIYKMK